MNTIFTLAILAAHAAYILFYYKRRCAYGIAYSRSRLREWETVPSFKRLIANAEDKVHSKLVGGGSFFFLTLSLVAWAAAWPVGLLGSWYHALIITGTPMFISEFSWKGIPYLTMKLKQFHQRILTRVEEDINGKGKEEKG